MYNNYMIPRTIHVITFHNMITPCPSLLPLFINDTPTPEIYTLSLHDALPISEGRHVLASHVFWDAAPGQSPAFSQLWEVRSEEHTSELQSLRHLVCRLLLEKKKKNKINKHIEH